MKSGIDQEALIAQFASASAKQTAQLRQAVHDATVGALQGRELSLANIRKVVNTVTQAATAGAAQNTKIDAVNLLDQAVAGLDDAVLKAVEANRVALQQFVDRGADLRETQLKKALGDLEKFEDMFLGAVKKGASAAGNPLAGPWGEVLKKFDMGGTLTGAGASGAAEQLANQVQTALRDGRAIGLKAAQTLAESYSALVSGVLIGMSDAMRGAGSTKGKK